jgi:hypothetical protein
VVAGLEGPAPHLRVRTRKKVEKRILPTFRNIPLGDLDPSTIGMWKAAMVAEQLSPQTVNTYRSLLGTILNAAVDDDSLRSAAVDALAAGLAVEVTDDGTVFSTKVRSRRGASCSYPQATSDSSTTTTGPGVTSNRYRAR